MRSRHLLRWLLGLIALAIFILAGAGSAFAEVTGAADDLRTGWYPHEPSLTPAVVSGGSFEQAFDRTLPGKGQIYAQPLVADNTLLVATEDDRAFGLNPVTGSIRWERSFGEPVAWNDPEIDCEDLKPEIGITGTPVIDTETNVAYFTSNSYIKKEEKGNPGRPIAWYMQAVELSSGKEVAGFPVEIAGEAQNLPGVKFEAPEELQRPALLLMNGVVYAGFGSHCDKPLFQGWLVGVSAAEHRLTTMWATAAGGGSIWQAGGGLISDAPGQILFATGNGPGDGAEAFPLPGPGTDPTEGRLAEAVVRVEVQPEGNLKATDLFSPYNNALLDESDLDLGSAAPIALPSEYFGTKKVPDLLLQASKEGNMYLLNRDALGGVAQGTGGEDADVQTLKGNGGVWDGAAVWPGNGGYVYVPSVSPGGASGGSSGNLHFFKYGVEATEEPTLSLAATSPETFWFGSGSPIVTSDGTTSGTAVLWITQCPEQGCGNARLVAYNPVPLGEKLLQVLGEWPIGTANKFSRPDAENGHIYVGDSEGRIFGYSGPQLTPSSTSLDLGTALTGAQLTGTVTLTDTGPSSLTVGAVRSPSAPFEATGLPPEGAVIEQGQTLTVHVAFRSATPGSFKGSLSLHTAAGETEVALSGTAEAPPPEELTKPNEPGGTGTPEQGKTGTTSLTPTNPLGPSLTLSEPLASLTHPHLAYPASKRGRGHRELRLTFTLSAAGTVQIAIDRRVLSHNCRRGVHTCVHDVPTSVKLTVAGHAGRNVLTVNLAGLPAGDYRLALTPRTRTGTAGSTRYVDFKTVR
jgi:hypothetical protein